jgi:Flp pilus assembly protein TadG
MKNAKKIKNKSIRGVAAIEAAIVFPLLIVLTLGLVEYGWMFLKAHQVTNAARQASRISIRAGVDNYDVVGSVDDSMASAGITGYSITITPSDVAIVDVGEKIRVEVSVPWVNMAIMNIPLLPAPDNLSASVTMAKEGL